MAQRLNRKTAIVVVCRSGPFDSRIVGGGEMLSVLSPDGCLWGVRVKAVRFANCCEEPCGSLYKASQCGATAEYDLDDLGPGGQGFESRLGQLIFSFQKNCYVAHFAGNAQLAEPSPPFPHRARLGPLNCENEYLVLAIWEKTAVQAVVGSIFWAFCRLKKPRNREMSGRDYALHSVRLQLSFFQLGNTLQRLVSYVEYHN